MNWKFWQKITHESGDDGKLSGPTTIPEPVARYMVVDLKKNAEWVWYLKAVVRPRLETKHEFDFRVYEGGKVTAENIRVWDYTSLDNYQSLIVLQGTFNRKTGEVRTDLPDDVSLQAA